MCQSYQLQSIETRKRAVTWTSLYCMNRALPSPCVCRHYRPFKRKRMLGIAVNWIRTLARVCLHCLRLYERSAANTDFIRFHMQWSARERCSFFLSFFFWGAKEGHVWNWTFECIRIWLQCLRVVTALHHQCKFECIFFSFFVRLHLEFECWEIKLVNNVVWNCV